MKLPEQLLLSAALLAGSAFAAEDGFKLSGNMEVWGYASGQQRLEHSPFNPGNRVAKLPSAQLTAEMRFNLRLRNDSTEFVLRPRLLQQHDIGRSGNPDSGDATLSQGFVRQRLGAAWTITAGRELLTWGPGNFRSPSNPIYFDSGKANPLRDISGVDLVRIAHTAGAWSATLAQVFSDAHLGDQPVQEALTLAKADWRGEESLVSVIAATPVHSAPFLGAFAQTALGDAWLLYGEIGNGRRKQALNTNPDPAGAPFLLSQPSPRQTTSLVGASYTLENGQSLALEALHDGHGFRRNDARHYFARADAIATTYLAAPNTAQTALQLRALGQALGQSPALLGRDYLSLQWQSNPQENEQFWRLTWSANLSDRSQQLTAYYEKNLGPRWSVFSAVNAQRGPAASEANRLLRQTLTLGVKFFAF